MPAGDKTGASDPFVVARCSGQMAKSKTKYETLNPSFFETLEMKVNLPKGLLDGKLGKDSLPKSVINIMVFDEDTDILKNKKKVLLGRTLINIDAESIKESRAEFSKSLNKKLKLEAEGQTGGELQIRYELVPQSS